VLFGLGQKSMTQSTQASIGMSLHLLPYLTRPFYRHPRPERPCRVLGACKDEFQATSISHADTANSAVEKLPEKHGAEDVKRYYSNFDVAGSD
jgi:hypothetical protein